MLQKLIKSIVSIVRKIIGGILYKKMLPKEFGGASIYVTPRADIRLLAFGWKGPANDLMLVSRKYIRSGAIVWDVGSNLGILSFCAAAKAGPSGKIFTIEADPKYAEIQNKSARRLPSTYAPVIPLCAAVSSEFSILSLVVPKNGHARNHLNIVEGNAAHQTESTKAVITVTMDFLRDCWPAPDFLKIDVEGAELLALQGATRILRDDRPIIYIEVNEENSDKVTAVLLDHSYQLFSLDANGCELPIERCTFNTLAKPLR